MRSKISSKLIFASCVWYSDRAHYELCVLIKDIGRRLPLQLQCSYQGQQDDFSQSVRGNYKTRFWGGQHLTAVKGKGGPGFDQKRAGIMIVETIAIIIDSYPRNSIVEPIQVAHRSGYLLPHSSVHAGNSIVLVYYCSMLAVTLIQEIPFCRELCDDNYPGNSVQQRDLQINNPSNIT